MIDHQLYATRGHHPKKRSIFSMATRGFSFGVLVRLGIRLLSPITNMLGLTSIVKIKAADESAL